MKIAILIDQLVPGGVQKAAIEETHQFKNLGHKAQLFVLTKTNYNYQYQDLLKGLKVTYLSDLNPLLFRKTIKIPFFSFLTTNHLLGPFFVKKYRQLSKYDLIISHGTTTCFTTLAIKKIYKVPYFAFIWDPMEFILRKVYPSTPLRFISPILERVVYHLQRSILLNASMVLTPSNVHKTSITRVHSVPVKVIPPGHNFKIINKINRGSYILGYSRWQKEKNPDFFLKLAKSIDTPIVLAGLWTDKSELAEFKKTVKQQKLNIKIIESVKHHDIQKLAKNAIVWVHPNFEAFGMPGLELAAFAVPIIIPQGSGVTELFQNKKHGFFPHPLDWPVMIKKAKFLASNPELAKKMGKSAAKIAQKYTWKKHSENIHTIINNWKKQPQRITIINNGYTSTKSIGGGDRIMQEIARRLIGVNITLMTPEIGAYHWKKTVNTSIHYHLLPSNRYDGSQSSLKIFLAYIIRSYYTFRDLHRLMSPNVLITTSELLPDILPAFLYKITHPDIPWITRFFHLIPPPCKRQGDFIVNLASWTMQQISIILIRSSNYILVDNSLLTKDLVKQGIPQKKIQVHYGGVDIKNIREYKTISHSKYQALFVGRLANHKGVFDLVPIWKQVAKTLPNAKLAIVGNGPKPVKNKLKKQIKKAQLSKNIKIFGYLKHEEKNRTSLLDILKSSKILLFTDHEAGFGLTVLEAMAAKLPVIAYKLPIFGNVYTKGFITVPLGSINNFSNKITDILNDQKKYFTLSKQASKQAEKYDWKLASQKMNKLLKSL